MKYIKLKFDYDKFSFNKTNSLNGYTKNKLYYGQSNHIMYIDVEKLESGKEKFKKKLLEYYSNIITKIEEQI